MDVSHDHTDFGPQIPFLAFLPLKVHMMGHMTYFIFEPHNAQPRDNLPNWPKNIQH
jgi:hypothetical protein